VKKEFSFSFDIYHSEKELPPDDASLLQQAREETKKAYAPYSRFRVAAAARLSNGQIIAGTNQENASFPAGICAERVLLSSVSSIYPGFYIDTIAISYHNEQGDSSHPISPCGICRQSLQEYEHRSIHPIRLILGGMTGRIHVLPSAAVLLPLAFRGVELK
jgi:cytidine deaminase